MKNSPDWFVFEGMDLLDTPALLVYPQRVQQNIDTALALVGRPERLRPHVKTHKSADLTRLLLASGIRQFKCSTIAEAEMLAQEGAPDVLLAYQPVGPKTDRLLQLLENYPATEFSCLVDNREAAGALLQQARERGISLGVYLDLDVGMHRTGIRPDQEALEFYLELYQQPGLALKGLHAYDGHIADADPILRQQRVEAAFAPVLAMRETLLARGCAAVEIIAGGMPSFPFLAKHPALVCSPGTFVYWDASYSTKLADTPFVPAALVLSRVVSKPAPNRVTLDLGHKSIASENGLDKRVEWLNAAGLLPAGHSEEHFFFTGEACASLQIADLLVGLPYHICPTVALYEKAITIIDQQVAGSWETTARARTLRV
ncbi:D-TA family PLP-dependent enzyme [Flavihumibacter sp. CACIAM 22H1]|uniref:D-TA family PLP-dependent enzyme n=1 Tax=Flavihumibacter sp. CACIAM 22H1 TaxID=1812911 RepID=UPI0007A8A979|nr:D-TA family PLP-dependent enzyme [Flavihumibacter sp. CACIAM 22H1]KYP15481.1 MAG: threonine aldolase [Flavihumibacter sp. CACIAM 22H1]